MADSIIADEGLRRRGLWEHLLERGGPEDIQPTVLRDLGIYGGAQGVWVDKDRTAHLCEGGTGITVALLHTGRHYPDDWSLESVNYHYPDTGRPESRDCNEIEATKNAKRHNLPVFVITHSKHSLRTAYLGWVADWDDASKHFLIELSNTWPVDSDVPVCVITDELADSEFQPFSKSKKTYHKAASRPGQPRFNFQVFKRYGPACVVCDLAIRELLQAAHVIPKEENGTDDPRNGLVLCANHHLAFDSGLFTIEPETLAVRFRTPGFDSQKLGITHTDLQHVANAPHQLALSWRFEHWK